LDFGKVIQTLFRHLEEEGFPYAVIGGVALAAYGSTRTTVDLDLVTDRAAQADLVAFLESLGYETLHRSSGYSNHVHPDPDWGAVDFVYVGGETSRKLFAATSRRPGPRDIPLPLPKPEHLVAMKVVAMKNDPARTFQELADVRFLIGLPKVDRREVRSYFARHGLEERFDELERTS
jgi:hypothetical protein